MAEAIARERHGADGTEFVSAGTVGLADRPMTVEAVDALGEIGIASDPHAAAPLDADLVAAADHIYVMEAHHAQWITTRWPESWARVQLLDPSGRAVHDPFGSPPAAYRAARDHIVRALAARAGDWRRDAAQ